MPAEEFLRDEVDVAQRLFDHQFRIGCFGPDYFLGSYLTTAFEEQYPRVVDDLFSALPRNHAFREWNFPGEEVRAPYLVPQ